jgi:hypothetical protein
MYLEINQSYQSRKHSTAGVATLDATLKPLNVVAVAAMYGLPSATKSHERQRENLDV